MPKLIHSSGSLLTQTQFPCIAARVNSPTSPLPVHRRLLAWFLAFACCLSAVQAQTTYSLSITNTAGTNIWSSSNIWTPVGVPGDTDTAIVSASSAGNNGSLRLATNATVGTFNFANDPSGTSGLVSMRSDGSAARTFTASVFNYQVTNASAGGFRFESVTTSNGLITVNIGTLNFASNATRTLFFSGTLAPSNNPILASVTVTNLSMSNGTLSIGAVRRSTSDPVNVNLGNITMSGGLINLSETAGTFANTVEANSLSGSNGTIRVSGTAPASLLEGTVRLIGSGSTSSSIALQDGGSLRQLNLAYAGTGTQTLTGSNNYTGTTTISSGALNISNAWALGATNTGTTVTSGGALEVQGGITVTNEALTIGGSGVSSGGALRSLAGTNAYNGSVTLTTNARINVDAGTLNLTNVGTITGSGFGLTVGGAGNLVVTRVIGTGTGSLTKDGAGTVTLNATNTYTGNTTVSAGTLRLGTNGSLQFLIGGSGTNTALLGAGTTVLDGRFALDLTGAATNTNATWTLVASTLTNSYGTNFLVTAFNGAGGNWTNTTNGVNYVFAQSTGILSVQSTNPVGNYASWVSYWTNAVPGFTSTAGTDNPDGDPFDNNEEFAFDGNPTIGSPALLTATKVGTNSVFNYVGRKNPPGGVSYQVQMTTNLSAGPWTNSPVTVSNAANQSGINITNDYERKEFTVPAAAQEFYRVQASIVP